MFDDVPNTPPQPQASPVPQPTSMPTQPAATTPIAPNTTTGSAEEIHTMPMDYYTGGRPADIGKSGSATMSPAPQMSSAAPGGRKKIMNIAIVVGLVLIVGVAAYLLYASYKQPGTEEEQIVLEEETDQNVAPEEGSATEEQPEVNPEDVPPPVEIDEETSEEDMIKFDPSKLSAISLALMASLDKDKDGLTDMEETVIGTDPNLNDTDKDTYRDGDEMKNFFSPLKSGSVRLNEAPFVQSYANPTYGYKLLYPVGWMASALRAENPNEVMITSKGNEFVSIFVDTKSPEQTLEQWYLEKAPTITATQIKKYQNYRKLNVIESPDGFTAYIANDNKVYIINYNIGLNQEANYPGLFGMMINSFELMPIETSFTQLDINYAGVMEALGVETSIDNDKVVLESGCGSNDCFWEALYACEEGLGVLKLADNLTYEISLTGESAGIQRCFYVSRFTKIDKPEWAGKLMKCEYNFDVPTVEPLLSNVNNCTGDLANLIKSSQQ